MIENNVEIEAGEKLEVRKVKAKCPECGGELVFTGVEFCTFPPQYEHRCNDCGFKVDLYNKYPNYMTIGADLIHGA